MKRCWMVLGALFLGWSCRAEALTGVSLEVDPLSSCDQVLLRVAVAGTDLGDEGAAVSSLDSAISASITKGPDTFQGSGVVLARTVSFNRSLNPTELIGISYSIGQSPIARAFVVYSCGNNEAIYTCFQSDDSCPATLKEYLPQAVIISKDSDLSSPYPSTEYGSVNVRNAGVLPLTLSEIRIEGDGSFLLGKSSVTVPAARDAYLEFKTKIGSVGTKTATLVATTNDPFNPILRVSLSSTGRREIALGCTVKAGPVSDRNGDRIEGVVRVTNYGFGRLMPGAEARVWIGGYGSDTYAQSLVTSKKLGALKRRERERFEFVSKRHDFTKGVGNKEVEVAVQSGRRKITCSDYIN